MDSLRSRLPPTSCLVAFEAAARLLSFTEAAGEMGMTQAAVSRHIKALEDHLGTPLFLRQHRTVRLTPEGERLFAAVHSGLERIADTTTALRQSGGPAQITVSATIAFGSFWLMPRLGRFRESHPGVQVRLVASDHYVDPGSNGVDLAIRYGTGRWPGLESTLLFREEVFPVCSSDYRTKHPELRTPADLLRQELLYMESEHATWIDWDAWLGAFGVDADRERTGPRINTYTILIQSAVAGEGIALGWRHLVEHLLANGSLVRPLKESLPVPGGYYIVLREGQPPRPHHAAFRDWILNEVRTHGEMPSVEAGEAVADGQPIGP
jgi:putative choline sulfate-utilization transcription factor